MRIPALVVALLLVFSGVVPPVSAAGDAESGAPRVASPQTVPAAQADGTVGGSPHTVMRVRLQNDGDARWRVEVRYDLESQNETEAFEQIGSAYENGSADVGVDADFFRRVAERVSESTGREMRIQNTTHEYSVDRSAGTGTLVVEFVWTDFLRRTENGDLAMGDAFVLPSEESEESRTWLSLLSADQRLVVETPPGYATNTTSIRVKQQNNAIIVDGPATFEGENSLLVTYRRTEDTEEIPWDLVVGGGVAVALLVLVAALLVRRQSGTNGGRPGAPQPTPERGGATNGGVGTGPPVEVGEAASEPPAEGDEEAADDADGDDGVDLSLLSDEERVEHLLEQNGGRMKQANIVKETGWSDAKVSQLLSAMADEGRVDKLRLGRENLISLPDEEA